MNDLSDHDVRTQEIIRLRVEAASLPEIANKLGVTVRDIDRALDEHAARAFSSLEPRRTIDLDLMRLDELQKAFFAQAKADEISAAALIIKMQGRRASLMGLNAPLRVDPIKLAEAAKPQLDSKNPRGR